MQYLLVNGDHILDSNKFIHQYNFTVCMLYVLTECLFVMVAIALAIVIVVLSLSASTWPSIRFTGNCVVTMVTGAYYIESPTCIEI